MAFSFRPATREHAKLLIGLCGPSGSGKTLSALKLATGLGGTIAYVDTEGGRACQYADDYSFLHATLDPPFHPDRYGQIIEAAVKVNPGVIIIDSASHVWEGPGGILDMVDNARQTSKNDFGIWAAPKQAHQKLVNRLIQLPAHVIICFRAKEKRGLVPDPRRPGKQEVVNLGWHPIAESGVVYELTINCLLSSDKKGAPIVDGFDFGKLPYNMHHLLPAGRQIDEETGRSFAAWAKGGSSTAKSNGQAKTSIVDDIDQDSDGIGFPEHELGPDDRPKKNAKQLLHEITACNDTGELAELDLDLQAVMAGFSDSTRTTLQTEMTKATQRCFGGAA